MKKRKRRNKINFQKNPYNQFNFQRLLNMFRKIIKIYPSEDRTHPNKKFPSQIRKIHQL